MIEELAKQSVQKKIQLKSNTMLGNYEMYYAAGILCEKLHLKVEEGIEPKELQGFLDSQAWGKELADETAAHLAKLIHFYAPTDNYDEQMTKLFQMGQKDSAIC